MEWPFRRFVKAFDAYQRRILCDEWKHRKAVHLAAMYANTNLDLESNDRAAIVTKLEEQYDTIIAKIWNGGELSPVEEKEEKAWQSPFMRAGRSQIEMVQDAAARVVGPKSMKLPGEAEIGALPA